MKPQKEIRVYQTPRRSAGDCGGDKSTQRQDIENAELYWQDYKRRI